MMQSLPSDPPAACPKCGNQIAVELTLINSRRDAGAGPPNVAKQVSRCLLTDSPLPVRGKIRKPCRGKRLLLWPICTDEWSQPK